MSGGLGNQLFKWANGLSAVATLNVPLILNTWFYYDGQYVNPATTLREFQLKSIGSVGQTFTEKRKRGILRPTFLRFTQHIGYSITITSNTKKHLLHLESNKLTRWFRIRPRVIILRGDFESLEELPDRDLLNVHLSTPFPHSAWFHSMASESERVSPIGIHIRLTDYLKRPDLYPILTVDYYRESLHHLRSIIDTNAIWLFSDDLPKALDLLRPLDIELTPISPPPSNPVPDFEILLLLSMCKGIVTANSTFSWWSGYLAPSHTPVVMPKNFLMTEASNPSSRLHVPSWRVVES